MGADVGVQGALVDVCGKKKAERLPGSQESPEPSPAPFPSKPAVSLHCGPLGLFFAAGSVLCIGECFGLYPPHANSTLPDISPDLAKCNLCSHGGAGVGGDGLSSVWNPWNENLYSSNMIQIKAIVIADITECVLFCAY